MTDEGRREGPDYDDGRGAHNGYGGSGEYADRGARRPGAGESGGGAQPSPRRQRARPRRGSDEANAAPGAQEARKGQPNQENQDNQENQEDRQFPPGDSPEPFDRPDRQDPASAASPPPDGRDAGAAENVGPYGSGEQAPGASPSGDSGRGSRRRRTGGTEAPAADREGRSGGRNVSSAPDASASAASATSSTRDPSNPMNDGPAYEASRVSESGAGGRLAGAKDAAAGGAAAVGGKLGDLARRRPWRSSSARGAGEGTLKEHGGKILAGVMIVAVGYLGLGGPLPFTDAGGPAGGERRAETPPQAASGSDGSDGASGASGGSGSNASGERASGERAQARSGQGEAQGAGGSGGSNNADVRETGVEYQAVEVQDEEASIHAAERTWGGSAQDAAGGERQVISVKGPTNASFETGIGMPSGGLSVGAFTGRLSDLQGNAAEGAEYRATYNTFTPEADSSNVRAHGEYFVSGENGVVAQGSYVDRREEGSEKVVRTYTDAPRSAGGDGRSFSVSFEAPKNALVPELVGYKAPASLEEGDV